MLRAASRAGPSSPWRGGARAAPFASGPSSSRQTECVIDDGWVARGARRRRVGSLIGQLPHDVEVDRTLGELASTIELKQQPVPLIDRREHPRDFNRRERARMPAGGDPDEQEGRGGTPPRRRGEHALGRRTVRRSTRPARRTPPPSRPAGRASSRS